MDNKIQVIEMNSGAGAVDMLKSIVSSLYMEWEEDLLETELPQEVDFDSKEEYDKACKEFMLDLVEQAKEYKEDIFKGVLETYNQFLTNKYDFENAAKESDQRSIETIDRMMGDIKHTGILVVLLSIMFPGALPYLALFNIPRVGIDVMSIRRNTRNLLKTEAIKQEIDSVIEPLYWFQDELRTDYHKSNKEFKELREKALNGENVVESLLQMMRPERLSLPRENILKGLEFEIPEALIEEEKQYVKKEGNQ